MPIPITNLDLSDITSELGETNSNVGKYKTFLSPKVQAIGLDPTYCPGSNIQQRLNNLRTSPLELGKFRNYETMSLSYRCGHLYSIGSLDSEKKGTGIHIPNGWRIPTSSDIFSFFRSIDPNFEWGVGGNVLAPSFRSTITEQQINDFNLFYVNRTGETLILPQYPKPGWANDISALDIYGFKMIPTGFISGIFNSITYGNIGIYLSIWIESGYGVYDFNTQCISINSIDNSINNIYSADTQDLYKMCSIRLLKDDSTDPGYLEDIDGNIYETVKINNFVFTKENIRTTTMKNGEQALEVFNGGLYPWKIPAFYRTDFLDIY